MSVAPIRPGAWAWWPANAHQYVGWQQDLRTHGVAVCEVGTPKDARVLVGVLNALEASPLPEFPDDLPSAA